MTRLPFFWKTRMHYRHSYDPLHIYELIVTNEICHKIEIETNTYVEQYLRHNELKTHSRCRKWVPITYLDIKMYICALLHQGIFWKPAKAPGFHSIISHDSCVNLEKFIHFFDNENLPEKYSRTARINSRFDYFASCFQKLFTTDWDISVDESLLLWKGRLSWKQYIWRKRFGLKSIVLWCKNLICLEFYFV